MTADSPGVRVISDPQHVKERKMTMNKMMKKLAYGMVAFVALVGILLVSGCNPQKVGGGGLLQAYSRATGRYK